MCFTVLTVSVRHWKMAGGMEMKKVHGALSFCTKRQQHAVGALRSQSFYQQIESVFFIPFLSFILKQGMLHIFYASSCRNTLVNKVHCIQKQSASYFRLYLATSGLFQGWFSHYNRIGCFSNPQIPQMYS